VACHCSWSTRTEVDEAWLSITAALTMPPDQVGPYAEHRWRWLVIGLIAWLLPTLYVRFAFPFTASTPVIIRFLVGLSFGAVPGLGLGLGFLFADRSPVHIDQDGNPIESSPTA
jgi:hypothetical protein